MFCSAQRKLSGRSKSRRLRPDDVGRLFDDETNREKRDMSVLSEQSCGRKKSWNAKENSVILVCGLRECSEPLLAQNGVTFDRSSGELLEQSTALTVHAVRNI